MKQIGLLLFIMVVSFSSCRKEVQAEPEEIPRIRTILVEFFPSFHEPSTGLVDLENGTVVFKRIGSRICYRAEYPHIHKIEAIKSISFKLDSCNYHYLNDSILFTEDDFTDRKHEAYDGIFNTILFVFDDGTIYDADLDNDRTVNQHELFIRMLDGAIAETQNDSLENKYFSSLRKYF